MPDKCFTQSWIEDHLMDDVFRGKIPDNKKKECFYKEPLDPVTKC